MKSPSEPSCSPSLESRIRAMSPWCLQLLANASWRKLTLLEVVTAGIVVSGPARRESRPISPRRSTHMAESSSSTVVADTPLHQPELRRVMGPKLLLLFIVGDILGTGIYAVTGNVANQVGGVVWLPFLVAFVVATLTAFSYLELVTKYPQAAGAALYTHRAFGLHFLTFLVCFTVMCSGITSASTASRAFGANLAAFAGVVRGEGTGVDVSPGLVLTLALIFMAQIAAINLRGVAESDHTNIVLTLVELTGLLIVIFVGIY